MQGPVFCRRFHAVLAVATGCETLDAGTRSPVRPDPLGSVLSRDCATVSSRCRARGVNTWSHVWWPNVRRVTPRRGAPFPLTLDRTSSAASRPHRGGAPLGSIAVAARSDEPPLARALPRPLAEVRISNGASRRQIAVARYRRTAVAV